MLRRAYIHVEKVICEVCGGTGSANDYGAPTRCYGNCADGWNLIEHLGDDPPADAKDFVAAHEHAMTRYESEVAELLDRLAAWHTPILNVTTGATVAAWHVHPRNWSKAPLHDSVPGPLEGVWAALDLPPLPVLGEVPGWAEQGAHAWAAAVAAGAKVPARFRVPPALAGRSFATLPDPFVPARAMVALPFRLFNVRDGVASIDALLDGSPPAGKR
jgi:hypothetical protein